MARANVVHVVCDNDDCINHSSVEAGSPEHGRWLYLEGTIGFVDATRGGRLYSEVDGILEFCTTRCLYQALEGLRGPVADDEV